MLETSRLTRTLTHMLRHSPAHYGVQVDAAGWADLASVLAALHRHHECWSQLPSDEFVEYLRTSPAGRFEFADGRIRAGYGHSLNVAPGGSARPPERLYHGTAWELWDQIQQVGLQPMTRRFVQLTTLFDYARAVASTKSLVSIVVVVRARSAWEAGVPFVSGNPHFWLAEQVPPEFLEPHPNDREPGLLRLCDTSTP